MVDYISQGKELLKAKKYGEARDNFTAYITAQTIEREESLGYYYRAIAWQEEGNIEQGEIDFANAERERKFGKKH